MAAWILYQILDFNVLTFISIVIFNTALSKNNLNKLLDKQSNQLYLELEELKDEIRGNAKN
jgi:hypothetical protein